MEISGYCTNLLFILNNNSRWKYNHRYYKTSVYKVFNVHVLYYYNNKFPKTIVDSLLLHIYTVNSTYIKNLYLCDIGLSNEWTGDGVAEWNQASLLTHTVAGSNLGHGRLSLSGQATV